MTQVRGAKATFALYDENNYGADPTTPDGKKLYLKSFGVVANRGLEDSETMMGTRGKSRPDPGNWDVGGGIEAELGPENIGFLLKHALGGLSTTGTGPYTHVLTPGDLPIGFTLEKDLALASLGASRYERYNGCRVGSLSLKFPQKGRPSASFDIKGAKFAQYAAPLDPTITDTGFRAFAAASYSLIEEGGANIATITDLEMKLNNNLDSDAYVINSQVRQELAEADVVIDGSIKALFTSTALFDKAMADQSSSVRIAMKRGTGLGSAGNEYFDAMIPQLVYELKGTPISGPKGLLVDLGFKAYLAGGNAGMQLTLKNQLTTL